MIVICEECGKRFRLDPDKIKGRAASFKCTACSHVIRVTKPEGAPPEPTAPPSPQQPAEPSTEVIDRGPRAPRFEKRERKPMKAALPTLRRLGIRPKMFLLLIIVPLVMLIVAVPFSYKYIKSAIDQIIDETAHSEVERAKNQINQTANALSKQVEFYLLSHPEITKENIANDKAVRDILTQPGLIGVEASLYLRFDPETPGTFLISPNKSLEGKPLKNLMVKGRLGNAEYDEFGKVIRIGPRSEHREATGFYLSRNNEGNLRERILSLSPVSRTPYGIIVTADTEDFMLPVRMLENHVKNLVLQTRNIVIIVFGGTLLIIGLILSVYGNNLTGKIRSLTDVTNRISVGELEAQIDITSSDEIGELAEAVSRMQDSIRLSIERLRRRR